jgi:type II secretory pathway predicted ATPase ExeA
MRWFNTAGPCEPARHFTLMDREGLPALVPLIDRRAYFGVYAPRQTGKTTAMRQLARQLTASGAYAAVHTSFEVGQAFTHHLDRLELALLSGLRAAAEDDLPEQLWPPPWPEAPMGDRLKLAFRAWVQRCPRPLVLLIDEIDALRDDALILVLRQLRDGFARRPAHFPQSIGLIGLRDVRDYVVAAGGKGRLGSGSPFNIKAESFRIGDFTPAETAALLHQHTEQTGQVFEPEAVDHLSHLSQGQPWLVNALAAQLVDHLVPDRATPITRRDVDEARRILVARQDTHLDQLVTRLEEPRVRAIVEPMLAGTSPEVLPIEDIRYVTDLGLLRVVDGGGLEVANPIYRDIIARTLSSSPRAGLPRIAPTWLGEDGALDPRRLMTAFLAFWRQHGEPLLRAAPYHEVAPHLVLMAFLDRVVNGGGRVEREYALGRGRMDLLVVVGEVRVAIELKVWRPGRVDPLAEGLEQLDGYLAGLGLETGWLVVFDRREGVPALEERLEHVTMRTPAGRVVEVVRS